MFKQFLKVSVCALSMVVASQTFAAFPEKPIRMIVPSSPGSAFDSLARVLEPELSKYFKQPVVVHNLAGASNMTGTREVVKSAPDGYTVGLISSTHAINPYMHAKMPYDAIKDITPITNLVVTPLIVTVPANSPYKTLADLVADAKAHPDTINYGSAGVGNSLHLATVLLENAAGIKMMHAPYKGGNLIVNDLIAGHLQMATMAIPSVLEQIKAGNLRALATTTSKRLKALPDVPSVAESYSGFDYATWLALIGPAGISDEVRDQWNQAIQEAMSKPEVQEKLAALGLVINTSTPDELAKHIQKDLDENKKLFEQINAGSK
ncbi:Bug family tripartite tricarboxylate transporter substrate binding protein [Pelistega europaea]|uniref:Tripartite tricarboxylate transporter substrate binding protein n=1 Tax=Pelistega europaea TaxID=106147 RepID=A0A7Y4P3M0_9BURK|nr:tripartite tricarboxylate transporter substrate binding protein [Pelistega europaea]NOL49152.1 tripartite tricarboxylate transporter substrate binding protein [Pelistega europaea]